VDREQLLKLVEQLTDACRVPGGGAGTFERICALLRSIETLAAAPAITALLLDVRFRAEDVYARTHLMPEAVLRQMLSDRLQLLAATLRAGNPGYDRRRPGSRGRRASDRAAIAEAVLAAV
jgi:hypothetical protein